VEEAPGTPESGRGRGRGGGMDAPVGRGATPRGTGFGRGGSPRDEQGKERGQNDGMAVVVMRVHMGLKMCLKLMLCWLL
jgi:hypothetical protein